METQLLHNRWLHSHEEDHEDVIVYRPEAYPFPPSRGRTGFELRADRSCEIIGVAAGDGSTRGSGRWRLDAALNLIIEETPGQRWVVRVVVVTRDRLVVRGSPPA